MHEQRRTQFFAYGVAVLAIGLSVLLRLALFGLVADRSPFITFFFAIILSAYIGGIRPGLLATLLSAVAADYFLIGPPGQLAPASPDDLIPLAVFMFASSAVALLTTTTPAQRAAPVT